jgi:hypothetical protein
MHALCVAVLMHLAVTTDEPPPPPPPPPSGLDQPPPPAPTTEAQPQEAPSAASKVRKPPAKPAGWARGAAYLGFGLGAALIAIGLTGDLIFTPGDNNPAWYTSLAGLILTGAGGPIIFIGARSARFDKGVQGSSLLRVLGWIGYGASIVAWFCAFGIQGAGTVAGVLGAGSLVAFGIDGIFSAQEAEELASIMTQAPPADGVQISPKFSMLRYRGETSPVIGLQGVF